MSLHISPLSPAGQQCHCIYHHSLPQGNNVTAYITTLSRRATMSLHISPLSPAGQQCHCIYHHSLPQGNNVTAYITTLSRRATMSLHISPLSPAGQFFIYACITNILIDVSEQFSIMRSDSMRYLNDTTLQHCLPPVLDMTHLSSHRTLNLFTKFFKLRPIFSTQFPPNFPTMYMVYIY